MKDYKIMFLDTETTGVVDMRTPYDNLDAWPHVIQLAYQVVLFAPATHGSKPKLAKVKEFNKLVSKPGLVIPKEAFEVHGITTERLQAEGTPASEVVNEFLKDFRQVDLVVAHNAVFDMKMLKAELLRVGNSTHLREIPWVDTMYHGRKWRTENGKGGKWPRLGELYQDLYNGEPSETLHLADSDVRVLIKVFEGLASKGLFDEKHMYYILKAHQQKPNARPISL